MTPDELRAFTTEVAEAFNAGEIPYPVHLSDGNERQLIDIFQGIEPYDWVFGSWRMHYHALLKGVSRQDLLAAIRRGESMALCFPEQRVFGSAIAGGMIPVAVGAALSVQRAAQPDMVYCFVGDMMAYSGIFHEAWNYASGHKLPIRWVVEDNGLSVCTDTRAVWGGKPPFMGSLSTISRYAYTSRYPHAGAGQRVEF